MSTQVPPGVSGEPDVVELRGARGWYLRESFTYLDRTRFVRIPAGFVCDLASVPRVVWALMAPSDLSEKAALIHDWIYRHAGRLPGGLVYTRAEADRLFLRIMEEEQVPTWKRWAAYAAVRVGGRHAWHDRYSPLAGD